jgi:hypothetical protein
MNVPLTNAVLGFAALRRTARNAPQPVPAPAGGPEPAQAEEVPAPANF